jgi:hypothetical protein
MIITMTAPYISKIDRFSPQNEDLNLLVQIKFLNLFYIYIGSGCSRVV